jgi:hypothetical protein
VEAATDESEPRAFRIPEVCQRTGLGRTTVYAAIKGGSLKARKYGRTTIALAACGHGSRLSRHFADLGVTKANPVSYVGLEYCTAEYCGRTKCSEACWFGTYRRRVRQVQAIRRLMQQFDPPLHKIIAWKPDWGCPYDWLWYIKPRIAKALMTRVFNSMCSMSVTAVGIFKVVPAGFNANRFLAELHVIAGGATKEELESAFRPVQPDASVRIEAVEDVNRVIDEVTTGNSPRLLEPYNDPPKRPELTEFYAWLAEMEVGTRLFRYGCDENFDLITFRRITINPKVKKERTGRRRYYRKRRKRKPYRPWDVSSPQDLASYYED